MTALAVLEGPAVGVFERLGVPVVKVSLEEAVAQAEWILCGTSWQSDLEWRAIRLARAVHRRVVALLDHWSEFADRFQRGGEGAIPDEIWVTDEFARTLASRIFKDVPVVLVENPYLAELEEAARTMGIRPVERTHARTVLMVTEPTSVHAQARYGDPRYWGYTELEAARYFLANAEVVFPAIERVVVRPHPSETAEKYLSLREVSSWPLTVVGGRPLLEHLLETDAVAGCNTMAMVVALRVGRAVACYIPPGGHQCLLPHPEILMVRDAAPRHVGQVDLP